jgi:hypothetical protein
VNEIKHTGGARIGWVNASWPFAKLTANSEILKLNVSLVGKYEFHKGQIISIKKYGFIPILASGIKIEHNVQSYPQSIIFWTLGSVKKLISNIEQTGLITGNPETNIQSTPRKKGFPVKIFPVITAAVIWNILFLADQKFSLNQTPGKPGILSILAIFLVFATSLAIKKNAAVANIFLKPDRSAGEITPMLNLFILVTGAMSIMFTLFLTLGVFK